MRAHRSHDAWQVRDGLHQLAITWIQLNHAREAIEALTRCYHLDPSNAVTTYYLAVLHGQRQDFNKCWLFLQQSEALCTQEGFYPKALKELRRSLIQLCPEQIQK